MGGTSTVGRMASRWSYLFLAVVVTAAALSGGLRLVVPAAAGPTADPPGVRRQLAFLRAQLDDGAGTAAQQIFPEGYFFLHVLYGLSWVDLGLRAAEEERGTALREARWALDRLDSPAGREPFSPELAPAYGVFYRGWTNWLRGGMLSLHTARARDPAELTRFAEDSAALAAAFDAAGSPYLPAYPGQAWPVDSTVAIASLRLHDTLLPARFDGTVDRWLSGVRQRLDPETGLLPHRVDPVRGAPVDGARGSSQSMILRFLVDVDPAFARAQYLGFRERFVATPLGLGPAVREYPAGTSGPGDVDSGPLLLGISLSATVVTLGAAQVQGDAALAGALANYGELAGVPVTTPWSKRYALGAVPIGDAFLAWSKAARPWVAEQVADQPPSISRWWRLPLLSLLVLLGAAPWLPLLLARHRHRTGTGTGTGAGAGPGPGGNRVPPSVEQPVQSDG
ncbi:hypothetical protein ACN28C_20210 [Plantactinospora sp. WMMC1484]|uniref:hypothetical protein n=1 Tax=Plantactinospora sp. WMMC1484 TaxID=3404122 RepID=UPI003BF58169